MINRFGPPMGGPGPFAPDDEEQARAIYRVRLMADLGLLPRLPGFQSPFGAGFGGAVDSAGMPRAPQAFSTALGGGQFASPVHPMSPGAQGGLWPRDDPGRAGLLSPADGDGRPMAPHEYGERILDPEPHHPGSRLAQPAADDVSG